MDRKLDRANLGIVTALALLVAIFFRLHYGSDWFEFLGFVTGVIGVYLVAVEHIWNFPVGLVNVTLYGYVFFSTRLFADMSLQVFFFLLGVMGWWQWSRKTSSGPLRVTTLSWLTRVVVVAAIALGTLIYIPIIQHFKGKVAELGSVLTVSSIAAQFLLNAKRVENWVIWILVDIMYIWVYWHQKLEATAVLYAIFLVLAVMGLVNWIRLMRSDASVDASAA
jgi:nicotinamide mononucleotide transporter